MRLAGLALLTMLWLIPEEASAQWGRGRGSSWNGPRNGYYGNYYGGYYGNTWGWRGGVFGPRYYYSGYPYGTYYSTPGYPYYYSSPNVYYSGSNVSNEPRTSTYYDAGAPTINERQARVQVRLANASDELIVQNVPVPSSGMVRDFVSPDLESGKNYVYTIAVRRAGSVATADDTRQLEVKAGGSYTIDFTSRSNVLPAPR